MKFSAYNLRTLKIALWIIAGYVIISALYSLNIHAVQFTYSYTLYDSLTGKYMTGPFTIIESLKRSTPIGFALGVVTAVIELIILPKIISRLSFLLSLIIRVIGYVVITMPIVYYGIIIEEMIILHTSFENVVNEPGFTSAATRIMLLVTIFSTISALGVSFVRLVSKKFGQGILLQYVLGKYHQPREEERIFMFMDLRSSTSIAEQLDHKKYHKFLNDIFHDISEPILEYRGEIYQYVGDEVVVTWSIGSGIKDERCIRCFFAISQVLERKNPHYIKKYGVEAKMKAGLHCGLVTTGEIGDLKTEIVYHGDAVNTTSRIQEMCNDLRASLLVSGDLLQRCKLSDKFVLEGGGTLKLRGKEKVIEVYSVTRKSSEM
ncbi:MAG: adenylate/guanylate cyclase domain-containing protein [Ignavibacteriales bacterium]|nr:adenylate/guanylate cyclase domain-containing protein [Ignavibacteriales bacterium]